MLNSRRGFTLMELIVVMAVISILVAMGVPRFIGYTKDADVTAMKVDAGMLEQVSLQHMLVNGDAWPVGAECSSIDPEVLAIVENVLRRRGSLASVSELAAAGAFCELDEAALSLYVRSTANSLSDYFIVNRVDGVDGYANELEGFVFSKEVFEDRSGVKWSGLYCEEEILLLEFEDLVSDGVMAQTSQQVIPMDCTLYITVEVDRQCLFHVIAGGSSSRHWELDLVGGKPKHCSANFEKGDSLWFAVEVASDNTTKGTVVCEGER